MINPRQLYAWLSFLGLVHLQLIAPDAYIMNIGLTLGLLLNTALLGEYSRRQYLGAIHIGRTLIPELTKEDSVKIQEALKKVKLPANTHLHLLDGDTANATANPYKNGWSVGITLKGIKLWTADEIAAVIGHELGHIESKHLKKGIRFQLRYEVFFFAFMLFAATMLGLAAKITGLDAAYGWCALVPMAIINFVDFVTKLKKMSFDMEYEADAFSAKTVNAHAMASALRKLSGSSSMHPELEDRIKRLYHISA